MTAATARAHANIALVKYWGKANRELNTPAAGSLSLTLDAFTTETTVSQIDGKSDRFTLNGREVTGTGLERLSSWLDIVRQLAGRDTRLAVRSTNDFPTASGLASSASAYAALAMAAPVCLGLELEPRELSILARRGSGSAARSIYGGLVRMHAATGDDERQAYAEPLVDAATLERDWPLRMVIAVVGGGQPKDVSSRDAMQSCQDTSPLYQGWIDSVDPDLARAEDAIRARDLTTLGSVTEGSAMAMHAAAMATRPAIVYWRPTTLAIVERVRSMRADGVAGYFTMDAGPHVKVLTMRDDAQTIADQLAELDGVSEVRVSRPGGQARVS